MLDTIATKRRAYLLIDKQVPLSVTILYRDPKSAYDVFTDEVCNSSPHGLPKRNCLNPLCEIFSGCEDPYVAIGWWMDSPDQVKPQSVKRPRSEHILQQHGRLVT
ncbi:hypothetical protein L3X38_036341 [Prunus dulcis]|uniref:Uncharacterized protein n=1 Tax=Prunus dulcis TaxID=3755 RepID=A0AAD4V1B5_PRUDU|nr:hypothetical protein L3X38_036341 [Prunus dulcis]